MKLFLKRAVAKFKYSFQGLFHGLSHDKSIRLQGCIALAVVLFCLPLSLKSYEWVLILSVILLVLSAEFINSAVEALCDKLYPGYHKEAKKIKDYTAAAVLLISMIAALVGILVIGGKLL